MGTKAYRLNQGGYKTNNLRVVVSWLRCTMDSCIFHVNKALLCFIIIYTIRKTTTRVPIIVEQPTKKSRETRFRQFEESLLATKRTCVALVCFPIGSIHCTSSIHFSNKTLDYYVIRKLITSCWYCFSLIFFLKKTIPYTL